MRNYKLPLFIFLFALVVRGGYFLFLGAPHTVMLAENGGSELYDTHDYHRLACSIREHGVYGYEGRASSYRPPAYPTFIAVVYTLFGTSPRAVRVVQIILSALTCVLLAIAAGHIAGENGLLFAGIFAALHPFFIFYSVQLLSETLTLFWISMVWVLFFRSKKSMFLMVLIGVFWGLASLTRSIFLPLAMAPIMGMLLYAPQRGRTIVFFCIGIMIVVLPWSMRNTALHGAFVPISTNGGYNFYLGSAGYQSWSGRSTESLPINAPYDDTCMEGKVPPVLELVAEQQAYEVGITFLVSYTGVYIRNACMKIYDFWHILLSDNYSMVVRMGGGCYGFLLVGLGLVGLWELYSSPLPLHGTIAGFFLLASTLLHAVFISNIRMRIPLLDPLLIIMTAVGLPYLFIRLLRKKQMQQGVTVLMYHAIVADMDDVMRLAPVDRPYAVLLEQFCEQLDILVQGGYRVVDPTIFSATMLEAEAGRVLLTFDDGHDDFVRLALPELEKRGFKATLFMTSGYLGKPGYLKATELKSCVERGITVGGHGHSHTFFSGMNNEVLLEEVMLSQNIIQKATGCVVDTLSLPGGRGVCHLKLLHTSGYKHVFTSHMGRAIPGETDAGIKRIPVRLLTTTRDLSKILTGDPVFCGWMEMHAALKKMIRTLAGDRLYNWLYVLRYRKEKVV